MKLNFSAIFFFLFIGSLSAQTTTFTAQVCQTKSQGTLGLDRNQWAYDNNQVNEAFQHDFPPINVVAPCGDATPTSLLFSLDVTSITDLTDGSTCNWLGIFANIYVDCPGNCYINQNVNDGCDNFPNAGFLSTGNYTIDLMNCPATPMPNVNSTLNFDVVSSMDWGLSGCSCNATSLSSNKTDFEYTICIDYEYEVPALPVAVVSSNSPVCYDGTIELDASGGTSYEWDGPAGFSSSDQNPQITNATNLEEGIYTVTVTGDVPGCETIETVNVVVADELIVSIDNSTEPTCYLYTDGTANLSATGGFDTNYSYDWFPGGFNSSSVNILEGEITYEVTVTDGAGCEGTVEVELEQPDELFITIDDEENPSCFGIEDGIIGVFASGGDEGPFNYTWSPGGFTGDLIITLSGDVEYQIVATDGNGCTASEIVELIQPDSVGINFLKAESPKCFGDTTGFAIVVGTGGNGLFDYDWSNGVTIDTAANLLPDSTYGITVTDFNGCSFDDTIRLASPDSLKLDLLNAIDPDCGGANGSATVGASGGMGSLSYIWQPSGITDSVATGLTGGIPYTVTAIDTNNCSKQLVITLNDAPAFSTAISNTSDPTCAGVANGAATVTPSGGTGPFRYIWPGGNTSATANNLLGDSTYSVTILDVNDCEVVDTVRLTDPQPLVANINNSMDPTCAGAANGFASVLIAGGGSNSTVNWTPGNQSGLTATGLSGGINYTVSITDGNNCSTTSSITLTEPAPVIAAITGDTIFCEGETRPLTGNAGFANYSWSNSTGTQNITVADAGTYILTVTDAAGCEGVDSVLVNHYPIANPQIQGSISFCTGTSTTLELAGFSSYNWSTGGVDSFIMVNTPGQITVDVVDLNGCIGKDTVIISESSSLNPTIGGALSFCEGDSTTLSAGSGFADYSWSNTNNSNVVNITSAGTYSVTVQDATGCTGADTVVVVQNLNPTVGISGAADFCEGDTIQLSANNNFSSYNWNGTPGNQFLNVTASGNYNLEVIDANGCVADASVSVNFLATPSVNISGDITFCEGDTIQLDAGANFSSYSWNTGGNSQSINVSESGDYIVNIEGMNGCKNADTLTVSTLAPPLPSIQNAANFCEGDSIELTVGGGVFTDFEWSDNSVNSTLTILESGAVFLTVTDADGCEASAFANINTFPNPTVNISGSSTFCTGNSTTLDGGFGFSNYDWSNGTSGQTIMVSDPGFIELIVTDLNGCKAIDTLTISESASLAPNIVGNLEFCEGDSTVLDAGQGFSNYQWSTTDNSQTITVYQSGTIELTVEDASGCSGKDSVEVTVFQSITPTSLTPSICTGQVFTVGTNDYAVSGIYRDTFQNINGCDSLVITDLTVSSAIEEMVPMEICLGDSLFVGGGFQTNIGTYRDTVQSFGGCDSIVITALSFTSAIEETIPVQICPGTSYFAGGALQTTAGMYRDTFQSAQGCDSIAITDLALTSVIEISNPVEICPGLSYFAGGAMQTTVGMYRDTFQTLAGCDSVSVTELSFSPVTEVLSNTTICQGDSLFAGGIWQFDSGLYSETQSITGQCDTLFTVNLTVEPCAATLSLDIFPASCFGESDGSIEFSLTADLNASFVYELENTDNSSTSPGMLTSNSGTVMIDNLLGGNYILRIFDRSGNLETIENFVLTQPSEFVLVANATTNPTCHDATDGFVQLEATGGTPNYIFEWQNGSSQDERSDLVAGDYSVYAVDDNGCRDTLDFTITAPEAIFAEAVTTDASCAGKEDGNIEINNLSGGTGGYLFSLENTPFSNQNVFENLSPGAFDVVVQDANGCEFSIQNIIIQDGGGLNISLPIELTSLPGAAITLSPDINFTPTRIEWNPAEDLSCADCLEPTLTVSQSNTYTIIAFASDDCFAEASINILIDESGRDVFMPSAFSPNDDGINDVFYVNAGNQITNVKNFSVVDRWGGLMFQVKEVPPNDPLYGWNGEFRGKRMNSGVYGFFAEVEFADGSTTILKGDLTLLAEK